MSLVDDIREAHSSKEEIESDIAAIETEALNALAHRRFSFALRLIFGLYRSERRENEREERGFIPEEAAQAA